MPNKNGYLAGVRVVLGEAHAMKENKDDEGGYRETLDDSVKQRLCPSFSSKQHEIDRDSLEERNQLWSHALQLKVI